MLASRAAEKLVFGMASGGAGGAEVSDLAQAATSAAALDLSSGLGASGPIWPGAQHAAVAHSRRDLAMRGIIQNRLAALEKAASSVLHQNRGVLKGLAAALLDKGGVHGYELDHHMDGLRGQAAQAV